MFCCNLGLSVPLMLLSNAPFQTEIAKTPGRILQLCLTPENTVKKNRKTPENTTVGFPMFNV